MLNNYLNQIAMPLDLFVTQTLMWLGKLIFAYIIWLIGKYLINLTINVLDRMDIPGMQFDDEARRVLKMILAPLAKFILVLVILDTLGIGSNVVSALMSGVTFTISIALGLAFGRALEPYANELVQRVTRNVRK